MAGVLQANIPIDVRNILRNPAVWEWITGDQAPDEDTFTTELANAELQGYLHDHTLLRDTLATFVGFSYVRNEQLRRRLPMQHPRWPWLRCERVSIKGVKFDGTEDPIVGGGDAALQPNPKYRKYRFHIFYSNLAYDCRSDEAVLADGSGEWGRFVTILPTDEGEILTQEGGTYIYNAPGKSWNTQDFAGPVLRVRVERTDFHITAYGIAHDFLLNANGIPTNFVAAKSKVNSHEFLGFPVETMLLKSFKFTKTPQPIATANLDTLSFGCKVEMVFGYFNPTPTIVTETHKGWNLVPGPGGTGGWYYVETSAALGSQPLYQSYDHRKLLQYRAAAL